MIGTVVLAIFLASSFQHVNGRHLEPAASQFYDDIKGISPGFYETRSGLRNPAYRWPNATVAYEFADGFPTSSRKVFQAATKYISARTCVKFVPRTTQVDFVKVVSKDWCWSVVGRNGNMQEMSLAAECTYRHVIVHELIHALGFFHEHNRPDRDNYVKIHWENVIPGQEYNFRKLPESLVTSFGVEYDHGSLMHYPATASSFNGKVTMSSIPPGIQIGGAKGMSDKDILKVNRMYNCQMV